VRPRASLVSFARVGAIAAAACGTSSPSSPDASSVDAATVEAGGTIDVLAAIDASAGGDALDAAAHTDGAGGGAMDAPASDVTVEGGTTTLMKVTFYGWADNSPPGNAIAYPKNGGFPTVHDAAGGTGTFADPITFATDQAEIPIGTIIYIPFIEKYLVMEDDCTECDHDWSNGMHRHVDVWMNSNGTANTADLTACEDQWTEDSAAVEIDAPEGLPVTTSPLFDPTTNTCRSTP
jgi:3D (Asp-Asp-Asp) domain-containing protein